jgi:hypothetical protein
MRKFSEEEASNPQHTSSTNSPTQEELEIFLYWFEEELRIMFPDRVWSIFPFKKTGRYLYNPLSKQWIAALNTRQGILRLAAECGWSIAELVTRKLPSRSKNLDLWRIHYSYRLLCRMSNSHCLAGDFLLWTPPYADIDWSTTWNKSLLIYAHLLSNNPEIVRLTDPHLHVSLNDIQVNEMDYDPFTFFAVKASMQAFEKFQSSERTP